MVYLTQQDGNQTQIEFQELLQCSPLTVLYFYPKDDTPGCTKEAHDFSLMSDEFSQLGAQVVGVSKDSHKSHCSFINKYGLPFALISDQERVLHKQFDTLGQKSMYGKTYQGTIRSSFLLHKDSKIIHERRNVSVPNHVVDILTTIRKYIDS